MPRFSSIVEALPAMTPFVAPEALTRMGGAPVRLRLGANESAFGPSPKAVQAMRERAAQVNHYGDPENYDLRESLAAKLGISSASLVVGAGVDELLSLFARLFLDSGSPVVTTLGSYATFEFGVAGSGGVLFRVPYRNDSPDLEGLAEEARRRDARLVYLANPDNPSGFWHAPAAIRAFREALPENSVLLLDEAYGDFAPETTDGRFSPDDPGLIRLRTFSKAHGMAGARIGYAIAHPVTVKALDKIRLHFGVNAVAQAGALASLNDEEHLADLIRATAAGRANLAAIATSVGLRPLPSFTNFVTIDVGSREAADALLLALRGEGVFIRKPMAPPLDRCVRITVGLPEDLAQLETILRSLLKVP